MVTIYTQEFRKNTEEGEYIMVELRGLSTDTKPIKIGNTLIGNGSQFIEINTGKIFLYDLASQTWKEI